MIILEGPDGSGKTTMARHIEERFPDLEYRRHSGLSSTTGPDEAMPDWWRAQLVMPKKELDRGVYDRCYFISEVIYGLAVQWKQPVLTGREMRDAFIDLSNNEPVVIFCLPPWEVTLGNIRADTKPLKDVTEQQLEKIYWAYWAWYGLFSIAHWENTWFHDYTEPKSEGRIFRRIEGKRRREH